MRLRNAPNTAFPVVAPSRSEPEPRERPRIVEQPARRRSPLIALLVVGGIGVFLLAMVGILGVVAVLLVTGSDESKSPVANNSTGSPTAADSDPPGTSNSGELSAQTLSRLKKMTVFIKSDFGFAGSSGTGFLVRVEDRNGYIVTNDHVARGNPLADEEDRPGARARRGARLQPRQTSVIFDSGTPQERTALAQIVATDETHDLAILKVSDVANLPQPIDLSGAPELRETLQVFVLGFPLGRLLAGGRNPAITVGKASISSLRHDRSNRLSRVQLQGDVNPGNSGGPVVDARGRLVGVAVASIEGTQIAVAIPPQDVLDLLQRRNYRINVSSSSTNADQSNVQFQVELLDLVEGVKQVRVLYLVGQSLTPEAQRAVDGRFPMLQNARELVLTPIGGKFTGRLTVRANEIIQNQLPYQVAYTTAGGQTLCNAPQNFNVSFANFAAPPMPMLPQPNAPPTVNFQPGATSDARKVLLAELDPFETHFGPWPLGKGTTGSIDTNSPIVVKGAKYPNGLGLHSSQAGEPSVVKYRLGKTANSFRGAVAFNDDNDGKIAGPTHFEVYGDGRQLWRSKSIRTRKQVDQFEIDLTGVEVLELRVGTSGSTFGAHAVWLDPILEGADSKAIRIAAGKK
jgi:S1-C subfamily serine protease